VKMIVDARGRLCPEPVVMTSKAIVKSDSITTIVDNAVAVENVTRFARSKGFTVEVEEKPDGIYLSLQKTGAPTESDVVIEQASCCDVKAIAAPTVLLVSSNEMGRGPAELGERLLGVFFHTLLELAAKPKTIIFINTGVKLAVQGSRALDDLRALASQGVEILACGTCLNYFELTDKLAVGRVSNMYDIANELLGAGKVVEL
jgi:selenium metabolism protein YedF